MNDSDIATRNNTHSMSLKSGCRMLNELLQRPQLTCKTPRWDPYGEKFWKAITLKKSLEILCLTKTSIDVISDIYTNHKRKLLEREHYVLEKVVV